MKRLETIGLITARKMYTSVMFLPEIGQGLLLVSTPITKGLQKEVRIYKVKGILEEKRG